LQTFANIVSRVTYLSSRLPKAISSPPR